ncbi:S8 family peptidase [Peribacillus frigoritolerans]|uniref:S8 family peptidase n=1 Tax=Peribacillus frigoritolerans TaxID=450367 RepID=UPI0020405DCF|nr:S8 family peptidase [Peribacillus frigoritolerans]MCM3169667.1 S8 family peptidase [Peribacillus frigoritolerans]
MKRATLFSFTLLVISSVIFWILNDDLHMRERDNNEKFSKEVNIDKNEQTEFTWSYEYLNVQEIHDTMQVFGEGISIAILDTGIDTTHKDLHVKGGVNIISDQQSYDDDNGHGTHLAGIIAAQPNGQGIKGIAPKADIYSVKVLKNDQTGSYEGIAKGIDWAIDNEIDIVLMSFGGSKDHPVLRKAIKKAYSKNITLIASTGNNALSNNSITYPAKYKEVIAVGALAENGQRWVGSNTGEEITVMAPGQKIKSTYNDGDYIVSSGTSLASAHVAGGLSLLLNSNPKLTNKDLKEILKQSALDKTSEGDPIFNLKELLTFGKTYTNM